LKKNYFIFIQTWPTC